MNKENASMERYCASSSRGMPPSSQTVGIGQALRQAFLPDAYPDAHTNDWMKLLKKLEQR